MNRSLPVFIIIASMLVSFTACNDDDGEYNYDFDDYVMSANTAITAFSIASNDSVLEDLDSVYFAIDLNTAQIYNADSLPKGTDISRLVINITTSDASAVDVIYPTEAGDTTINYLEHTTDSIDFSRGPVTVRVTAANAVAKRDYTVKVNVHEMVPDSLYWHETSMCPLPSGLNSFTWQKTVEYKGKAYCFTGGATRQMCVASTQNPFEISDWTTDAASLTFDPDGSTLAAGSDALYMLDTAGNLYSSADGLAWTSCGVKWSTIYCGYGDKVLGLQKQGDDYYVVTYPAGNAVKADADFPVSGTSNPVAFVTDWQMQPQVMMVGGIKANGEPAGDTWAYDGNEWMKISLEGMPARSGMSFFPYFTFRNTGSAEWVVSKFTAWIALGGTDAEGKPCKDVFLSLDAGMHWKKADQFLQLPDCVPAMTGSQALVFETRLGSRSASGWNMMPDRELPFWWKIASTTGSRAVTPLTQWECPYVYLFGGYDEQGNLYNTVWRGVINRLTFKPLQ